MTVRILIGDVRARLKELADESVHCVVTSPPYWGLRDYGTAKWEGGAADCDHSNIRKGDFEARSTGSSRDPIRGGDCAKCGAIRIDSQVGLEPTYAEHIEIIADIFDEVKRVLRKDGTLWLNYGDSYATSVNGRSAADTKAVGNDDRTFRDKPFSTVQGKLKAKDLCGVPWRVAFALQERGWWLRQDIIWSKPNPMPESVKDRCTKAHEYIFLLTKSPRYYFDAEAIAEEATPGTHTTTEKSFGTQAAGKGVNPSGNQIPGAVMSWGATRNKRSVWEIATSPFPEAHFATFPPELPEICIKAGTSEKGCCGKCGKPWIRNIEVSRTYESGSAKSGTPIKGKQGAVQGGGVTKDLRLGPVVHTTTLGWQGCQCVLHDGPPVPCTVLDPFGGAGTTGLVADRLGRDAILIELNREYAALAERRIHNDSPLFVNVKAAE